MKSLLRGDNIKDFYVGKNNIYYIQKNGHIDNIMKADLNHENAIDFNLPENWSAMLIGEVGNNIYLSLLTAQGKLREEPRPDVYEFDFDTNKLNKSSLSKFISNSDEAVSDGKYLYYKVKEV